MNMETYTDRNQGIELVGIVPIESADMYYKPFDNYPSFFGAEGNSVGKKTFEGVPCWSLGALLDVLPFPQLSKDKLGSGKVGWMVSAYPNDCRYDSCWQDNPIDACVAIIEKLNELKLL
jgi:hypothetical protein